MSDPLYPHHDFEARIRILSKEEGGRKTAVFNGIRWDFVYRQDKDSDTLYMIWPDFCDEDGHSISEWTPLPVGKKLRARMFVLVDEMRAAVHRGRISPGLRFYCVEGPFRMAEGIVRGITGLFTPRPPLPEVSKTPASE